MNPQNLIEMANSIAAFFAAEPVRADAVRGIATHLSRFWEPRMHRQLRAAIAGGQASGLDPLVTEALAQLEQPKAA